MGAGVGVGVGGRGSGSGAHELVGCLCGLVRGECALGRLVDVGRMGESLRGRGGSGVGVEGRVSRAWLVSARLMSRLSAATC